MDAPLDDEDMMTQAMGFSSFGSQNRPQKRKYNPHADAIVSSDSATAQRAARPSATGSNSTPLGLPTRKPDQAAANADEIDLDEEDEDEVDGDGAASDAAGIPERPGEASTPALVRPPGLPDRPPPGIGFMGSSKGHQDSHGAAAQDGSRRTVEWEGYYDPSSNENPWRRLEESRGLQSLGTWIPRGHQASASS
ncbi:hypothetical protein TsFJ059_003348 [Trichoderma semiorbis]|uniref:Uncharacterized protein n=1 Tax=Trichoderma semiorbis TaxID=1491008 RepID=A0A9P8KVW7_9HYPO|nr:hypothetical protein TsFJ059_003348 [Trichoderma semiorbis]